MGRGPQDRRIGTIVTVIELEGPYQGYVGIIKDANGPIARIELWTGNKAIMVDKEILYLRLWAFLPLLDRLTCLNGCTGQMISLSLCKKGAQA